MYYKLKSNIMYRDYGEFGYITDNRNFGYKIDSSRDIGDKILSKSGSVFLSTLKKVPLDINYISRQIKMYYVDVQEETIRKDAIEFYSILEEEGFVVSGMTKQECKEKDYLFSYEEFQLSTSSDVCTHDKTLKKSTQEFFAEQFGGKKQLTNVHIEITAQCNERCLHCYIPHEYKLKSMDSLTMFNLLKQCREMNVLNITISGGEPMLHDNFIELLQKCREYNFSVNVLSNLTILSDEIIEEMKLNRLLSVQTSIYSMNEVIHDTITQCSGSLNKTLDAVYRLQQCNIPLQISCPILKENIDTYKEVIEWGTKNNIDVGTDYAIIAGYDHTTTNLGSRLKINDIESILYDRAMNESGFVENLEQEAMEKRSLRPEDNVCSVCESTICVNEAGDIYPCAGWQGYVLGNLRESTLMEVWNDSEKVKYLRGLYRQEFPKCLECDDSDFCTMCLVRNSNEDPLGDSLKVSQFYCDIVKARKKLVKDVQRTL